MNDKGHAWETILEQAQAVPEEEWAKVESVEELKRRESDQKQCVEYVYVRDTYRRTGKGPRGFELHYRRQRCSRLTKPGSEYCWQHPNPRNLDSLRFR